MREIRVRIPDQHLEQLAQLAQDDDRTTSYMIRRAVRFYLQNGENGDALVAHRDMPRTGACRGLHVSATP